MPSPVVSVIVILSCCLLIALCYTLFHSQKWLYSKFMKLKLQESWPTQSPSNTLGTTLAICSHDHGFICLQYWGGGSCVFKCFQNCIGFKAPQSLNVSWLIPQLSTWLCFHLEGRKFSWFFFHTTKCANHLLVHCGYVINLGLN